jgi:hypothetical protein
MRSNSFLVRISCFIVACAALSATASATTFFLDDFSADPFGGAWQTNNAAQYHWDGTTGTLFTDNYTNSGNWASTPISYDGQSFELSFEILPIRGASETGDITFGLLGPTRFTNGSDADTHEERVFVLFGGFENQIYVDGWNAAGERIWSGPGSGLMQNNAWHHVELNFDPASNSLSLHVSREGVPVLDWQTTLNYGFSSSLLYLGTSMAGNWTASNRHAQAYIDNVCLSPGSLDWCDGFEGQPSNGWTTGWHGTGNTPGIAVDNSMAYSGSSSIRTVGVVGGCWGAGATRQVEMVLPLQITFAVQNGHELIHGCHPFRGGFGIRAGGPDWWDCPCPTLLTFTSDGGVRINGPDGEFTDFSGYPLNTWHTVQCVLTAPGDALLHATISVNGEFLKETVWPEEPWIIGPVFLGIGADEGTAWYDDICVSSSPAAVPLSADIKPGSCPNPLNLSMRDGTDGIITTNHGDEHTINEEESAFKAAPDGSSSRTVIPVAVLGTDELDVYEIDRASLTLAGVSPMRSAFEDVSTPMPAGAAECECNTLGPDGLTDLTLKFDKAAIIAALGSVSDGQVVPLALAGEMMDGTAIEGQDCVVIHIGGSGQGIAVSDPTLPALGACYPNPFNPSTSFAVYLPMKSAYTLTIYNIAGQTVRAFTGNGDAGVTTVTWDGTDDRGVQIASGVYLYRLHAGEFIDTKRMVLLK